MTEFISSDPAHKREEGACLPGVYVLTESLSEFRLYGDELHRMSVLSTAFRWFATGSAHDVQVGAPWRGVDDRHGGWVTSAVRSIRLIDADGQLVCEWSTPGATLVNPVDLASTVLVKGLRPG